jgi:uncharacterized protein (DUF2267 family)
VEENTMRTVTRYAIAGSAVMGAVAVLWPGTTLHAAARRRVSMAARRGRHLRGRLHGAIYRLESRRPDPNVSDLVLTDRIRSSLGPLEKRLDVPHLHVMVEDHVALLHGAVPTKADAEQLEHAVEAISGVEGVESYLHVGLGASDTRPSAGREAQAHEPSAAMRRLLDEAICAGVDQNVALPVVRGVLATFAERLPVGERRHVAAHLPADVKAMFAAPRRRGSTNPARHVDDLIARILSTTTSLPRDHAIEVTVAVVRALRSLVPDETAGVAAVLPAELRQLWLNASPVSP